MIASPCDCIAATPLLYAAHTRRRAEVVAEEAATECRATVPRRSSGARRVQAEITWNHKMWCLLFTDVVFTAVPERARLGASVERGPGTCLCHQHEPLTFSPGP